MTRLYALAFCLLPFLAQAQAKKPLPVDSKIEKVTVFLKGAVIERSAKPVLTAGTSTIVIGGLSPKVDKQSIQVKADQKITILSVVHQLNFLKEQEAREEITAIETQKKAIQEKMQLTITQTNVFKQEESLIIKNQQIKGEQSTLKATELKEAADFQRQRLTEIYTKLSELEREQQSYLQQSAKLDAQLNAVNDKKNKATSEVLITLQTKEAISSPLTLTYLVKEASWYPTYDIRLTDIAHPLDFNYKANISQNSGEDWKEVKLLLSTGNPSEDGTKPSLLPWYLRYSAPVPVGMILPNNGSMSNTSYGRITDETGMPIIGATVSIKGTKIATSTNKDGFYYLQNSDPNATLIVSFVGFETAEIKAGSSMTTLALSMSASRLDEVVVIGYSSSGNSDGSSYSNNYSEVKRKKTPSAVSTTLLYQPTSTVYEISQPYSVPNDGKQYTVDIDAFDIDAQYEYYAAPKIESAAFLTARIINWQELNLLPGEASLYVEGTFIGKSFLDLFNASDTLSLSLGRDKGVQVKRTLLKESSQKRFLGSNKIDSRTYEIMVRNNKNVAINIVVEDQFPISPSKEIEVDNTKATEAEKDNDTQKLTWRMTLAPKEDKKQTLSYTVKYPKEKNVRID